MSDKLAVQENKLPTLQELVKDIALYQENDKLNFLLNQEPPKSWIKYHPFIKTKNDVVLVWPHKDCVFNA